AARKRVAAVDAHAPKPAATAEAREEVRRSIAETVRRAGDAAGPALGTVARRLYRQFAEAGVEGMDARLDAVHTVLRQTNLQMTRAEVMDAVSGYGKFRPYTKEGLQKELDQQYGEMQSLAKLRDMESGQAPLKTGFGRPEPSAEKKRLEKLVNEKKKELGYDV